MPCSLCRQVVVWRWREPVPPRVHSSCQPDPHAPACDACGAKTDLWFTLRDAHMGGWVASMTCRQHVPDAQFRTRHSGEMWVSAWDDEARAMPLDD